MSVKHKFDSIVSRNMEAIARIEKFDETLRACTYRIEYKDNYYHCHQEFRSIILSEFVDEWRCYHEFKQIPSLFQNTPSHQVRGFQDLKKFQCGLETVLCSAVQFIGTEILHAMPIINVFGENFETIASCLNEIERKIENLRDSARFGQGKIKYFQEQVALMNNELKFLVDDPLVSFGNQLPFSGTKFVWNWKAAASSVIIQNNGATAKKSYTCGYAVVMSDAWWVSGAHVWHIKVDTVGCYDTIGIADESYSGGTKPLLVGLGTYPGSHRTDGDGVKFTNGLATIGSVIRCTLDLGLNFEFVCEYLGKDMKYTIPLIKYYTKGTKLYPALTLCHSSSYTIIDPPTSS